MLTLFNNERVDKKEMMCYNYYTVCNQFVIIQVKILQNRK